MARPFNRLAVIHNVEFSPYVDVPSRAIEALSIYHCCHLSVSLWIYMYTDLLVLLNQVIYYGANGLAY
jgi:hypothetical protein